MLSYLLRRLLLIIPTLFGIMVITFIIIQAAPGGPVEQMIAKIRGNNVDATSRITGSGMETTQALEQMGETHFSESKYRGAQGLDPEFIAKLEKMFGFDKPPLERFLLMMKNYLTFNFGDSYFKDRSVMQLVLEKMPVSISIGLWTTLLVYLIS